MRLSKAYSIGDLFSKYTKMYMIIGHKSICQCNRVNGEHYYVIRCIDMGPDIVVNSTDLEFGSYEEISIERY